MCKASANVIGPYQSDSTIQGVDQVHPLLPVYYLGKRGLSLALHCCNLQDGSCLATKPGVEYSIHKNLDELQQDSRRTDRGECASCMRPGKHSEYVNRVKFSRVSKSFDLAKAVLRI